MISLLISIGFFFVAIAVHILLHRLLARWGIRTVKTIIVYGIGLLILAKTVSMLPFPLTAIALYSVLVVAYLLYFISFIHDAESPSALVLDTVKAHGPVRLSGILSQFTNTGFLESRITMLKRTGLIRSYGHRLYCTHRGALIAGFFGWYRALLRWDDGG